ncbi:MAG: sulfite exporter TauE/SafE family protein [Flavobacteriales bacterium]|nr:sulfite exporter TauE/SafE family protein [Flavobacteriales bacterium]
MSTEVLALAFALVALLYASVGHGGASGYLALGAFIGLAQSEMRLPALLMNMAVSGVAFVQFQRAGHFRWKVFWPFALTSIPMAWLGAQVVLDPLVFERILAVCLLVAAARLLGLFGSPEKPVQPVNTPVALASGGVLGAVSGMIGIGGGIFLSPLLILLRWAEARTAAAVSALFILVNSSAGALGAFQRGESVHSGTGVWMAAAMLGGLLGSHLGARRLSPRWVQRMLGIVLVLASLKLFVP